MLIGFSYSKGLPEEVRMIKRSNFKAAIAFCLSAFAWCAHAQLNIDISGVGSRLFPVAIAPFVDEDAAPEKISDIIRADLARSGRFTNIDAGTAPVSDAGQSKIDLDNWKIKGADAFVAGRVIRLANGQYALHFRLYDTVKQVDLGGLSLTGPASVLRMNAHRIADEIYLKLLGERGVFATRMAYIIRSGNRYQLQISDSDGQNAHIALTSAEPIISPVWSPDGRKLAYVSFERKKPIVYVHDLTSGQRRVVSNRKGNNSAPAWSPDGKRLALALSLSGNTQIYLVNADGSGLRRLSNNHHIDTEPQFSPDGQWIYFTSDRGGQPQIYRMPIQGEARGGGAQRITFNGNYNTTPRISPNGHLLAYISRSQGTYKLHVQDLGSGETTALTQTRRDEAPSFAANSAYVLYATDLNGRSVLAIVSTDGRIRQTLSVSGGDVREPSWGPFVN